MHLNAAGEMIQAVWGEIPANYPDVGIAGFVVMPNHVHGIIVLAGSSPRVGVTPRGCPDFRSPPMAAGQPPGVAPTAWERMRTMAPVPGGIRP